MNLSSAPLVALVSVCVGVDTVCLVIAAMKGRLVLVLFCVVLSFSMFGPFGMGLLGPIVPVVGACRLARPRSTWARRYYDAEKLQRATYRFS